MDFSNNAMAIMMADQAEKNYAVINLENKRLADMAMHDWDMNNRIPERKPKPRILMNLNRAQFFEFYQEDYSTATSRATSFSEYQGMDPADLRPKTTTVEVGRVAPNPFNPTGVVTDRIPQPSSGVQTSAVSAPSAPKTGKKAKKSGKK